MPSICSLLPSATEIVFALGLGDDLVAVTHECDYPPQAGKLPVATSSVLDSGEAGSQRIHQHISQSLHSGSSIYNLDHELLERVQPELILTQELCDVCAVAYGEVMRAVRRLSGERQVLSLEPRDLAGILESIRQVALRSGVPERGEALIEGLQQRINSVIVRTALLRHRPRVFALEWLDPPFVGGHWVPEMIRLAGGSDGIGVEGERSRAISWDEVVEFDPQVIVLMPCGFSLRQTLERFSDIARPEAWEAMPAVREGRLYAVDGSSYFNRPGPRIVDGLEILAEILHPEAFPRRSLPDAWTKL